MNMCPSGRWRVERFILSYFFTFFDLRLHYIAMFVHVVNDRFKV